MRPEEILCLFPEGIRDRWREVAGQAEDLQEIRLRAGMPTAVWIANRESFVDLQGRIVDRPEKAARSSADELEELLKHLCRYSVYAFADEIRQGFLTVQGGHRAGLSGQVILDQDGRIKNMKYIRYLNIRIAHEVKGVSDKTLPFLYNQGEVLNTLIISPPGCGKTTMLRDLVRNISGGTAYGRGRNVGLVDERSEIAGSYLGIPQNDIGIRTDVMDACPKREGMMMLIRSMAPDVLAVDELGNAEDVEAMHRAVRCGCKMLATIHSYSLEEVSRKSYMRTVMEERLFDRYLLLGKKNNKCIVTGIYDRERKLCSNLQESCC